jgi:chemotaxis protein histidine kinase CheA
MLDENIKNRIKKKINEDTDITNFIKSFEYTNTYHKKNSKDNIIQYKFKYTTEDNSKEVGDRTKIFMPTIEVKNDGYILDYDTKIKEDKKDKFINVIFDSIKKNILEKKQEQKLEQLEEEEQKQKQKLEQKQKQEQKLEQKQKLEEEEQKQKQKQKLEQKQKQEQKLQEQKLQEQKLQEQKQKQKLEQELEQEQEQKQQKNITSKNDNIENEHTTKYNIKIKNFVIERGKVFCIYTEENSNQTNSIQVYQNNDPKKLKKYLKKKLDILNKKGVQEIKILEIIINQRNNKRDIETEQTLDYLSLYTFTYPRLKLYEEKNVFGLNDEIKGLINNQINDIKEFNIEDDNIKNEHVVILLFETIKIKNNIEVSIHDNENNEYKTINDGKIRYNKLYYVTKTSEFIIGLNNIINKNKTKKQKNE